MLKKSKRSRNETKLQEKSLRVGHLAAGHKNKEIGESMVSGDYRKGNRIILINLIQTFNANQMMGHKLKIGEL